MIVFRALGDVADKAILERICYDFNDSAMLELLRGSLEEAQFVSNQDLALDYIGKRTGRTFPVIFCLVFNGILHLARLVST